MPVFKVRFVYYTGIKRDIFDYAILKGNWDFRGVLTTGTWSEVPMEKRLGTDGCPIFTADLIFEACDEKTIFHWGVDLQLLSGSRKWGIFSENGDSENHQRYLTFYLDCKSSEKIQLETYRLSYHRYLGAQKYFPNPFDLNSPHIRFAVWAPHAKSVQVVFGNNTGYIAEDGSGIDRKQPSVQLRRQNNGIWEATGPDFASYVGRYYMFEIKKRNGAVVYRTDIYSRFQAGRGDQDPKGAHYRGTPKDLDGTKSCSVIIDPDSIKLFGSQISLPTFWQDEFKVGFEVPEQIEDLVIYELHVGALGFGKPGPGTFAHALNLLPYLEELGINAIELLPISEFNGNKSWGYATSHFLAIESSAGGREALMTFVKACHQRGIVVLMDVVYNHFAHDADRTQWLFDSDSHAENAYYWYEGHENDYSHWSGGYADNVSSGWAPRYSEPMVRHLFIDSAAMLIDEFHIDGFRVDQTTSIHNYNSLHHNGAPLSHANIHGAKFLLELCATIQAIHPPTFLIAEDHSTWDRITLPIEKGGIGFHATWYSDFYRHLIGDKGEGAEYAGLLLSAARNPAAPLKMDYFEGALYAAQFQKIVYHENHDEAGNSKYKFGPQEYSSQRTILVAVNGAPLVGPTRDFAEARARFAAGMAILSPGTPLFLMGEEVGATKAYTIDNFYENKEDLYTMRQESGNRLFRFYSELIRFRLKNPALRSRNFEPIHTNNSDRIVAFRRFEPDQEFFIIGSLNNYPFNKPGYYFFHPSLSGKNWREVFNSDAGPYGGSNWGNAGRSFYAHEGHLTVIVPANGFVVFKRIW